MPGLLYGGGLGSSGDFVGVDVSGKIVLKGSEGDFVGVDVSGKVVLRGSEDDFVGVDDPIEIVA